MRDRFVFGKESIILFVIGVVIITIGYIIMATGDITISPILLIIAYVFIFPLSILIGLMKRRSDDNENKS